jgi:hypothetical protein
VSIQDPGEALRRIGHNGHAQAVEHPKVKLMLGLVGELLPDWTWLATAGASDTGYLRRRHSGPEPLALMASVGSEPGMDLTAREGLLLFPSIKSSMVVPE